VADTPTTLFADPYAMRGEPAPGAAPHARKPRWRGRRINDKLLTVDRALLIGIFGVGAWVASADLRHGNLETRVIALEQLTEAQQVELVQHDKTLAVITVKLENLEKGVVALTESIARAVNRMPDGDR
jgi:hypothetical protein